MCSRPRSRSHWWVWQWQPIPAPVVWRVEGVGATAMWTMFWLGWGMVLLSTFLIDHFHLFGLRQAASRLLGDSTPEAEFRTPLLYRYVRHPLYLGFVLTFWFVPTMTAGHLLFSAGGTGYILVGIWFEERDLVSPVRRCLSAISRTGWNAGAVAQADVSAIGFLDALVLPLWQPFRPGLSFQPMCHFDQRPGVLPAILSQVFVYVFPAPGGEIVEDALQVRDLGRLSIGDLDEIVVSQLGSDDGKDRLDRKGSAHVGMVEATLDDRK